MRFHAAWNGGPSAGSLPPLRAQVWSEAVRAARRALLAQDGLVDRLLGFVAEKTLK